MQTVRADDVAAGFNSPHRSSAIDFTRLLNGEASALDNFELSLVRMGSSYTTPRHHHNFDQIHYVVEGRHNYSPDGGIPEGHVAYYPEGTYYGPQQGEGGLLLGLQMGGASQSGFMAYDDLRRGSDELAELGEFDDGTYRDVDETGSPRNRDGYEAVWEHVRGRPIEYPAARYHQPIVMDVSAFSWVDDLEHPGVSHKHLITLSERRLEVGFTRLEPGAELPLGRLAGGRVAFVLDGPLLCNGGTHERRTAFHFDSGDEVHWAAAEEPAEIYHVDLPRFPTG